MKNFNSEGSKWYMLVGILLSDRDARVYANEHRDSLPWKDAPPWPAAIVKQLLDNDTVPAREELARQNITFSQGEGLAVGFIRSMGEQVEAQSIREKLASMTLDKQMSLEDLKAQLHELIAQDEIPPEESAEEKANTEAVKADQAALQEKQRRAMNMPVDTPT